MSAPTSRCPGCRLEAPEHPGPTHAYIGASPACWARYGDLLAREYGQLDMPSGHRLTVDTYAVQHPGRPERRAIQSVAVHLIALHLLLDRAESPAHVTASLGRIIARLPELHWLEPPEPNGSLTVLHPLEVPPADHADRVLEWASDVWGAWAMHHDTVQRWLASSGPR